MVPVLCLVRFSGSSRCPELCYISDETETKCYLIIIITGHFFTRNFSGLRTLIFTNTFKLIMIYVKYTYIDTIKVFLFLITLFGQGRVVGVIISRFYISKISII